MRYRMAINVIVEKNNNESSANLLRRFTKKVQSSGVVNKVKKIRYFTRQKSKNVAHMSRLKKLKKTEHYEKMFKLGKISDTSRGRR